MSLIEKLHDEWKKYRSALKGVTATEAIVMQPAFYTGALAMYVMLMEVKPDEARLDKEFTRGLVKYMDELAAKWAAPPVQ
jgi:hypothetical protein